MLSTAYTKYFQQPPPLDSRETVVDSKHSRPWRPCGRVSAAVYHCRWLLSEAPSSHHSVDPVCPLVNRSVSPYTRRQMTLALIVLPSPPVFAR